MLRTWHAAVTVALGAVVACGAQEEPAVLPSITLTGPAAAGVGGAVTFEVQIRGDAGAGLLGLFAFDFADGGSVLMSPGPAAAHVYGRKGTFKPSVTLFDSRGLARVSATLAGGITIADPVPDAGGEVPGPRDGGADRSDGAIDAPGDAGLEGAADTGPGPDAVDAVSDAGDRPADAVVEPPGDAPVDPMPDAIVDAVVDPAIDAPPAAYAESSFAGFCTDIRSTGTVVGPLGDDDGAVVGLPFSFTFFGKGYTNAGISSNGYLQLVDTAPAALAVSNNVPIPNAGVPNAFVAALWDDLAPPSGLGSSTVHRLSRGTAPGREFVVQWTSWTFFSMTPVTPSSLSFQVILQESGAIELRYCTLTSASDPDRASGGGATVGLENETGTAGVAHSFQSKNSVAVGTVIRYTPN